MTVLTDEAMDLDPDHLIFEGIDTFRAYTSKKGEPKIRGPIFTVSEMAKFFFARTNHWVRWLESNGKMLDPDGDPVGNRRDAKMGNRIYTLGDIELVAHALASNGAISGAQLRHTLRLLRTQGEMNEVFPIEDEEPQDDEMPED